MPRRMMLPTRGDHMIKYEAAPPTVADNPFFEKIPLRKRPWPRPPHKWVIHTKMSPARLAPPHPYPRMVTAMDTSPLHQRIEAVSCLRCSSSISMGERPRAAAISADRPPLSHTRLLSCRHAPLRRPQDLLLQLEETDHGLPAVYSPISGDAIPPLSLSSPLRCWLPRFPATCPTSGSSR